MNAAKRASNVIKSETYFAMQPWWYRACQHYHWHQQVDTKSGERLSDIWLDASGVPVSLQQMELAERYFNPPKVKDGYISFNGRMIKVDDKGRVVRK